MVASEQTEPSLRRLAHFAGRFDSCRESKPVHVATITRWITTGVRKRDGSRLKLRAVRFPAGWRTCDEWVAEFLESLTADRGGPPTSAAREAQARRDYATLQASGW
jgi:hypothetical protein